MTDKKNKPIDEETSIKDDVSPEDLMKHITEAMMKANGIRTENERKIDGLIDNTINELKSRDGVEPPKKTVPYIKPLKKRFEDFDFPEKKEEQAVKLTGNKLRYLPLTVPLDFPYPENYIQLPQYEGESSATLLVGKYYFNPPDFDRVNDLGVGAYQGRNHTTRVNWDAAKIICQKLGGFLLSPRMFLDYLRLLREGAEENTTVYDGNSNEVSKEELGILYNHTVNAYQSRKLEWLDAHNQNGSISYNKIVGKKLTPATKTQSPFERKVNLDNLLDNSDEVGIPKNTSLLLPQDLKIQTEDCGLKGVCYFGECDGMRTLSYSGNKHHNGDGTCFRFARII